MDNGLHNLLYAKLFPHLHIDTSIFLLIHFWKALPFYRFFTQTEMPGTR